MVGTILDPTAISRSPSMHSDVGLTVEGQFSALVIRSVPEIEQAREIWTAWQQHPNADIDFYLNIARTSPNFVRPHILVAYRDGLPQAMLVGRIEHREIECKIGYRTVFKPRARVLNFVYGGMLGNLSAEASQSLVEVVTSSLRTEEVDIAHFNLLRTDQPVYAVARRAAGFLGNPWPALQTHRGTALSRNGEDLTSVLPRRIQRRIKKLISDFPGKVRIHCFRRTVELDRMVEDVEEVAKKTYQRGIGVGFVDDTVTRERLRLEAEKGWLRGHVLYVADRPCAFWIGTLYRGTFHTNFTGYDSDLGKYSPGMFLLMRVIEDLNGHGELVLNIDWGLGDAEYKEILGTCDWQEASVQIFARTFKGLRLNFFVSSCVLANRLVKSALERTELLARIKKLWRTQARQQ